MKIGIQQNKYQRCERKGFSKNQIKNNISRKFSSTTKIPKKVNKINKN